METGTTLDQAQLTRDSEWLRAYLNEHTGEDCYFDALLGRGGPSEHPLHATTIFESDRLCMFRDIVAYLTELCGGDDAASEWLFQNKYFESRGKDTPFRYLEDGEFDALWLLHSCLEVSVLDRRQQSAQQPAFLNPLGAALPE